MRRALVPMNSSMIVTEPLAASVWEEIGWQRREVLDDAAHVFVYLQRTADGRIAIGGRGVPYRFASRTDGDGARRGDGRQPARQAAEHVPGARGRGDRPRVVGRARRRARLVRRRSAPTPAAGWRGPAAMPAQGVAAANLAGRTLRDLAA